MFQELQMFLFKYWYISISLFLLNLFIAQPIAVNLLVYFNRYSLEGLGSRRIRKSVAIGFKERIRGYLVKYDKGELRSSFYEKLKVKMRKSGYKNIFAPVIYLFFKYVLPAIMFLIVSIFNYPDIIGSIIVAVFVFISTEVVVYTKKKDLNMRFRKYIYKIYRYLHNQISSGVSISDAVKTVYKVVHDKQIQHTLIEFAARYELTSDIDYSIEVFNKSFESDEVETLCLAIKQGIETGDNKDLLLRQERFMFSKYFSYIQAETDRSNLKSLAAALLFVFILVIMVSVPLIQEGAEGLSNIFIN